MDGSTNVRAWIGLTSITGASQGASDGPTGSYVAFRYSTSASDTHWQCVASNGTSTTVVDSGVAPTTGATFPKQQLAIVTHDGTMIDFYINGNKAATIATTLPATTTALRYVYNGTAVASPGRQIFIGQAWIFKDSTP